MAMGKFEKAVLLKPDDSITLNAWAQALMEKFKSLIELIELNELNQSPNVNHYLYQAIEKWYLASNIDALYDCIEWFLEHFNNTQLDNQLLLEYCFSQSDSIFALIEKLKPNHYLYSKWGKLYSLAAHKITTRKEYLMEQ